MSARNRSLKAPFRDYFLCADGAIGYITNEPVSQGVVHPAPTFMGDGKVGEEGVKYVLLSKGSNPTAPRGYRSPPEYVPVPVVEVIAEVHGMEPGSRVGLYDGDGSNTALTNVILPDKILQEQYAGRKQHPKSQSFANGSKVNSPNTASNRPCNVCKKSIMGGDKGMKTHIKNEHPETLVGPDSKGDD